MGNKVPSGATEKKTTKQILQDPQLKDYALVKHLLPPHSRFLYSIQCRHSEGSLVVLKVYFKWRQKGKSLRRYRLQLERLRNAIHPQLMPNILPYQRFVESKGKSQHSAFLIRQYLRSTLYDRFTSLPTLTKMEQLWIAYQLLQALSQIHKVNIYHGDIKSENVLLTSTNWLYLTDFAPFKPTLLPDNDPAGYYYFFENKGERNFKPCYLAPERFYTPSVGIGGTKSKANLLSKKNSMSIDPRNNDSNSSSGSSPTRSPALSPKSILSQDKDVESKLPMLDGGSVNRMNSGYSNSSNTGNGALNGEGEDDVSDVGSEDFRIPVTVVPFDASSSSSTSKYEDGTNEQDSTNRSRTSGTSGSSLDGSSTPPSITRTDSTMGPREAPLTAAMDIFSLGCVLAELFTEGDNSIFDLSNLLLYRQNDPTALAHVNNYLNTIENVYVKDMIYSMISLNPNERLTADEYLKRCTAKLTTNNQFTNANSENKISGKKISENKKCENKTSTTTTNDTDTGTAAEKITSAINDNGEEEEMHGKENVMYEGSVPVFPNHFHTWLFPFLKRLQCDPAFATADMKVLAITKHFSDIVTIVGGASRDQNNGNSENIFSTKLKNCINQKMKSKNINYNKESKGNNEKIEEMKVNKNEEKEELSQLDLLMASLHTTMKSLDPNKTPLNTEEKENTKTTPSPSTSNTAVENAPSKTIANTNPNGMVMIINVLCSCLQSVQGPELRLTTLQLLQHLSKYIYEQKQNQNDNQNQNNKNKNNQSQKNNTTAKKETKMNNNNNSSNSSNNSSNSSSNSSNNTTTINKKRHNVRLQRILPHVLQCAKDQDSRVRGASVQVLTALVESIESHHLQPEDVHLFPDYIFPALKTIIIKEIDGTAKMIFVNCISRLATESQRYLEMSRTFKQNEAFDTTEKEEKKRKETTQKEENDVYTKSIRVAGSYDKQLTHLRDLVSKIIASLVANYRTHSNGSSIGNSDQFLHILPLGNVQNKTLAHEWSTASKTADNIIKQTVRSSVKQLLLRQIQTLCRFFGSEASNEHLFPMMISFLNERDDWKLRSEFFRHITDVLKTSSSTNTDTDAGTDTGTNEYTNERPLIDALEMTSTLLPFIEDGLRDLHEVVIESAFRCLINITRVTTTTTYDNTNTTKIVVFIIDSVVPFVLHPTTAIRNRSIEFLSLVLHKSDIGLARTVVLPKLAPFLKCDLTLERHSTSDSNHSDDAVRNPRLSFQEIQSNIATLLIAPVDSVVLEAALEAPQCLEILRRNDSVVSMDPIDEDLFNRDGDEIEKLKSSNKHRKDGENAFPFDREMDEKSKLRLMESYIEVAHRQRKQKGRRQNVNSNRDRSNSMIAHRETMTQLYHHRLDVGHPVHSILIPDQRLNSSYYHTTSNFERAFHTSYYHTTSIIEETTSQFSYSVELPKYASARQGQRYNYSDRTSSSFSERSLDSEQQRHESINTTTTTTSSSTTGTQSTMQTNQSTNTMNTSSSSSPFDPYTTEDVAPLLFNGYHRDGWNDTEVSARVLARKYGAREHCVTKQRQVQMRKRQVHNQHVLKEHMESIKRGREELYRRQQQRQSVMDANGIISNERKNLHSKQTNNHKPDLHTPSTTINSEKEITRGGATQSRKRSRESFSILDSDVTTSEALLARPTLDLSNAVAFDAAVRHTQRSGTTTTNENSNHYSPVPKQILKRFDTNGLHPTELLRRVEALNVPPLPPDLGVTGTDMLEIFSKSSNAPDRSSSTSSRSLRKMQSTTSVLTKEEMYTDYMNDRTKDPAVMLSSFDYGHPDSSFDGTASGSGTNKYNAKHFDAMFGQYKNGISWSGCNQLHSRSKETKTRSSHNSEQSEEESTTTSKHPNNKERTKNGIYSFSHVALSSKHNSSNSSNTSSNSNHSNTGDDRYGEVMSTKTGWLSERGVQIVLQSDDAKMKKQIDSSTIDVLPFPPPETNEPSILDQKIDEAHQRQKRSLRIRTMGGMGGSGIASKSANSMSLVASLREHEANKSITTVVSSSQFFLTGSNDGTLKIWHSRGPRSMLEGGHHSVATHRFKKGSKPIGTDATVVLDNTRSVAVALKGNRKDRALLEVLRVDRMKKSVGSDFATGKASTGGSSSNNAACVLRIHSNPNNADNNHLNVEQSIVGVKHFVGATSSTLMYATNDGYIKGIDIRMRKEAFSLRTETRLGNLTTMTTSMYRTGGNSSGNQSWAPWAAVGTDCGYIATWDLRFMTLSKLWQCSNGNSGGHRSVRKLMAIDPMGDYYTGEGGDTKNVEREDTLDEDLDHLFRSSRNSTSHSTRKSNKGTRIGNPGSMSPSRESTIRRRKGRGRRQFREHGNSSHHLNRKESNHHNHSQFSTLNSSNSMSSSSTPWVMALLGSGTTTHDNEASLWNLDTGKCEHVFRVVPAVASDRAALHIPTLESIPLSIDPSWCPGVRIQGSSTSAARDFDPTKNYLSSQHLFGRKNKSSIPKNSKSNPSNHQKSGRKEAQKEAENGMRAMLWTPCVLPGAATPQLITAGEDTCIRVWDMYRSDSSFAVPNSSCNASRQYFESIDTTIDVGGMSSGGSWMRPRGASFSSSTSQQNGNGSGSGGNGGSSNLTVCQTATVPKGSESGAVATGLNGSAHDDAVLDLTMVRSEHHHLLLSSSRDGVVNVWRADWLVANVKDV